MARVIYNPPKMKRKELNRFPLKNLEKTFVYADFERKISPRHVNLITEAMVQGKFYDNELTVVKIKGDKYKVINGQHRIEALKKLRDKYRCKSYDLALLIAPQEEARDIYRRNNLGKKLNLLNHLKAIDAGNVKMFNRLRDWYSFNGSSHKGRYDSIFNALYYTKLDSMRAVHVKDIEKFLKTITEDDITKAREFTIAMQKVSDDAHSVIYKAPMFRTLFKVGYEVGFDRMTWQQFIKNCVNDVKVLQLADDKRYESQKQLYDYMKSIATNAKSDIKKIQDEIIDTRNKLKKIDEGGEQ
ncbi:MAG: hypothetical protein GTO02_13445 [Candidatus Dadabacteria bacterium]|nr:hypothetical protein [Candidatus Dadabacteria bacterium]